MAEDAAVPGIALAIALLGAAGSVWWSGSGTTTVNDGGMGELIAVTQAARAESSAAVQGDAAAFDALAADRAAIASLRAAVGANAAASADARRLASDAALWRRIESNLDTIIEARAPLAELDEARAEIIDLAPQLLLAVGNVASAVPPADLTANQPYIQRLELMVDSLQQNVRALGPTASVPDTVRRLEDAEQYLGEFVRGLRGEDNTLGVVAVRDVAQAEVTALSELHEGARQASADIGSGAEQLTAALAAISELDAAAAEVLTRYRATDVSIAAVTDTGMGRGCRCCSCSPRSQSRL